MILEQFKNMLLTMVLDALSFLLPKLFFIATAFLTLVCVLFFFYSVLRLLVPEIHDLIAGVAGEMWSAKKARVRENFSNSPVGSAYASYKEHSSVHDGAEVYVESYSLGPKEHSENVGSFSGYDYSGYGNVEFHEED